MERIIEKDNERLLTTLYHGKEGCSTQIDALSWRLHDEQEQDRPHQATNHIVDEDDDEGIDNRDK